jgi:molybdopterin biosynthesis enzyme MoaB
MAEQSGHTVGVGVLTVSDRVSRGEAEDLSGPLACSLIEQHLKHAKVRRALTILSNIKIINRNKNKNRLNEQGLSKN